MPLIDPITMSTTAQMTPLKASLPIELLPTDLARIFTHVHPTLLLSAYYLRFPALVADPVPTLLNSLLPLAIIQISYAVICLPATGSGTKPAKKPKPGARKADTPTTKPFVRFFFPTLRFTRS
jgi:phosphatidylinositol glycan class F